MRVYKDDRLRDCFPPLADFHKAGAPATFYAAQLPSQVGAVAGESLVAERCAAGYVTYGPYAELFPGAYRGRIDYEAKAASPEEAVGKWDLVLERPGRKDFLTVLKGPLSPESACIEFGFETDSACLVEVRTFYTGAGRLPRAQIDPGAGAVAGPVLLHLRNGHWHGGKDHDVGAVPIRPSRLG